MNKKLSLYSLIIACLIVPDSFAAVNVQNNSTSRASYAGAYRQVAAMQYNANANNTTTAESALPIAVANSATATAVANGDTSTGVTYDSLALCKNILPRGEMAWDTPNMGIGVGTGDRCVAVVEMRSVYGSKDIVLARANVSTGNSFKCNISNFPASSYTEEAGKITFPADREPTMDDVKQVLNQEQKDNAALKIAAGAITGGLLGNALGKGDADGKGKTFGTDKNKLTGAAIGALSGAAVMTAATQSGKVAGDVILGTSVNAVAGGAIGNMAATGDSVLLVNDCEIPGGAKSQCVWGTFVEAKPLTDKDAFFDIDELKTMTCDLNGKNCATANLIGYTLPEYNSVDKAKVENFAKLRGGDTQFYCLSKTSKDVTAENCNNGNGTWVKISDAKIPGKMTSAAVEWKQKKLFGNSVSDFYEWKATDGKKASVYFRDSVGGLRADENLNITNFYPLTESASDGGIIDVNNPARVKSTLTGAGVGAGLGGFTAYQGAKDEVDQRWISAVQEYHDSLERVYCATGNQFLSSYNDIAIIPAGSE